MTDFDDLRRTEFAALDGGGVYLNAASTGPVPSRSQAVLSACNRDRGRPAMWPVERINAVLDEARWLAARLINAGEDEIALMPNTTTGVNVAARALPLEAGDVVLTFDGEFPTNVYPWLAMASRGVVLERLPRTAAGWPDEAALYQRLEHPAVKAVSVSLTQFSNGYTVDLERLSRATRAAGKWLVVDAIQGLGHVPVDVQRTPVDFLACGGQKWLLSPWGTGFLHVRRDLCQRFEPTFAGWAAFRGTDDYTRLTAYDPHPWDDARRFEVLTFPVQDFAAWNASVGLLLSVGITAVGKHIQALEEPVVEWARMAGAEVTSPLDEHRSAILCIRPRGDVREAYARLQQHGVHCSLREGSLRLSPHVYNRVDEMTEVVRALAG